MQRYYDFLIVGAGLYGASFAYLAKRHGKRCLVIDKRPHTGGNVHCGNINCINVHQYGAHIFHTSNHEVWDFVSSLVELNRYTNSPMAFYKGKIYNLPFNMNTFNAMWGVTTPAQAVEIIEQQRKEAGIMEPHNLEEQAISLVGRDIYEILIKEYTEKQWGRPCTELPAFIIRRLPVRLTYDNNYFNDRWQGVPIGGYNVIFDRLLDGIEVRLQTDYFENRDYFDSLAEKTIFTGEIDRFYNYRFGPLEYRTLRFETELLEGVQNLQGNAVVNYTSHEVPWTRIIEHKHFEPENPYYCEKYTIITREYPSEWKYGAEPYYPVNDSKNNHLYSQYRELASAEKNVLFGGRLAEYKYYDMDDIIEKVLKDTENL